MGVRVDTAGHDVLSAGVDHPGAGAGFQCLADRGNALALAVHIGPEGPVGGHHGAAANQD